MATTQQVRLDRELVLSAELIAGVESRTTPKQIEHWIKIGKVMEENPELSYAFVKESLLAKAEYDNGDFVPYERIKKGRPQLS